MSGRVRHPWIVAKMNPLRRACLRCGVEESIQAPGELIDVFVLRSRAFELEHARCPEK